MHGSMHVSSPYSWKKQGGRRKGGHPCPFPRNVEPHRVGFENRRDLGEFLTGVTWQRARLRWRRMFLPMNCLIDRENPGEVISSIAGR